MPSIDNPNRYDIDPDFEWKPEYESKIEETAKSGLVSSGWPQLKNILKYKFKQNVESFMNTEDEDAPGPMPMDSEEFHEQLFNIYQMMDKFLSEAPFTIQRLCELALSPRSQYNLLPKYLRALDRVLNVTIPITSFPVDSFTTSTTGPGPGTGYLFPSPAGSRSSSASNSRNSTPFASPSSSPMMVSMLSPIPWLHNQDGGGQTQIDRGRGSSPSLDLTDLPDNLNLGPSALAASSPGSSSSVSSPSSAGSSVSPSQEWDRERRSMSPPTFLSPNSPSPSSKPDVTISGAMSPPSPSPSPGSRNRKDKDKNREKSEKETFMSPPDLPHPFRSPTGGERQDSPSSRSSPSSSSSNSSASSRRSPEREMDEKVAPMSPPPLSVAERRAARAKSPPSGIRFHSGSSSGSGGPSLLAATDSETIYFHPRGSSPGVSVSSTTAFSDGKPLSKPSIMGGLSSADPASTPTGGLVDEVDLGVGGQVASPIPLSATTDVDPPMRDENEDEDERGSHLGPRDENMSEGREQGSIGRSDGSGNGDEGKKEAVEKGLKDRFERAKEIAEEEENLEARMVNMETDKEAKCGNPKAVRNKEMETEKEEEEGEVMDTSE